MLQNEITLCMANYRLKKLFNHVRTTCIVCSNEVTHIFEPTSARKRSMSYNILCMNLRCKGGLVWLSKIRVFLTRLIAKSFETFLNSEVMTNEWHLAASSSRIVLNTSKEIIVDILLKSHVLNALKGECKCCNVSMKSRHVTPIINTIFNTTTNNVTLLLSRNNLAKKLSLKMIKELKKIERCVNFMKSKNDDEDASTLTCEFCKSFSESHSAVCQGNKVDLLDRCLLLKILIASSLEKLIQLSKTELRSMCAQLALPDTSDIPIDDMTKSVSETTFDNCSNTTDGMLAGIENEEELHS